MTHPTNGSSPSPQDLTGHLAREADQFTRRGGTELDVSQVLDRAGEIRRGRRMRATMVMAACVLAIAVPTALVATHRNAGQEPSPAPAVRTDHSPLTLTGLKDGKPPRIEYAQDGSVHSGAFTYTAHGEPAVALAAFKPDRTMFAVRDAHGDLHARALDSGKRWPMSGDFAVSAGGHVVAFVQPDGTPVVVQTDARSGTETFYTMPKIPRGSGFGVVAVTGEDCKETAANAGCTVWVNSSGRKPESWVSTSHGFADRASSRLLSVADVVAGRLVAGISQVTDTGSCSEVEPADTETPLWTTCEHRFLSFSPDGTRLLASAAYADGLGDSELAILDSRTGKTGLDLRTSDGAAITRTVWEDDSHVLATLYEKGRWAVLRIGLDGTRELALPPLADRGDLASPYVLPGS